MRNQMLDDAVFAPLGEHLELLVAEMVMQAVTIEFGQNSSLVDLDVVHLSIEPHQTRHRIHNPSKAAAHRFIVQRPRGRP